MIVQCQNCETRFHVADARIPAKGARVRCSRCHHRFHITPSTAPPATPGASSATQSPAAKVSAPEPARGGENVREEDQLDNPEFLFDKPQGGASAPPRPRAPEPAKARAKLAAPEREHATVRMAAPMVFDAPEPETPAPTRQDHVVESGGQTAQEMLDAGVPELEQTSYEIGGTLSEASTDAPPATIRPPDDEEIFEDEEANERDFLGDDASTPRPAAAPASAAPIMVTPAPADIAALAAELGEDEDSSFADWDPLATPAAPAQASTVPTLFSGAPATARATVFDQPDLPAPPAAKPRAVPQMQVVDPEAAGPMALILRIAAAVVGIALLGAAARLLWLQRDDVPPMAEAVQTAGWVAADLETFLARDATGERVLIVRGNLFPEGAAPPPEIDVRLLGADGVALAESRRTWLERIDDAEIAPDRLAPRLASTSGEIAALGQQVTGFTAVLSDPPPGVRRVEVVLRARTLPPTGTATAETPPESTPQSAAPATETAGPSTSTQPPAPGPSDVVPAAPAPEE